MNQSLKSENKANMLLREAGYQNNRETLRKNSNFLLSRVTVQMNIYLKYLPC